MSSESLLKNGKKHVVIVGAGAAGMVSQAREDLQASAYREKFRSEHAL